MIMIIYLMVWFVTELKSSLRKLEHENADLRFLNNQYVHKVRALEKESKSKTDRILLLQEKNFHAVVQTPGMLDKWNIIIPNIQSVCPPKMLFMGGIVVARVGGRMTGGNLWMW